MKRYLIDLTQKNDPISIGLKWVADGPSQEGHIVATQTKGILRNLLTSSPPYSLPLEQLRKHGQTTINQSVVRLFTPRLKGPVLTGRTLVLLPSAQFLRQIDQNTAFDPVLVVPWQRNECEWWVRLWQATIINESNLVAFLSSPEDF